MQALHKVQNVPEYCPWQGSKYAWLIFYRALNMPRVLNMLGLKILLSMRRIVNMRRLHRMLNMPK